MNFIAPPSRKKSSLVEAFRPRLVRANPPTSHPRTGIQSNPGSTAGCPMLHMSLTLLPTAFRWSEENLQSRGRGASLRKRHG